MLQRFRTPTRKMSPPDDPRRRPGALPFAVLRMDGTGETTIDDWPCVIRLADLVAVLREAGYGDE